MLQYINNRMIKPNKPEKLKKKKDTYVILKGGSLSKWMNRICNLAIKCSQIHLRISAKKFKEEEVKEHRKHDKQCNKRELR